MPTLFALPVSRGGFYVSRNSSKYRVGPLPHPPNKGKIILNEGKPWTNAVRITERNTMKRLLLLACPGYRSAYSGRVGVVEEKTETKADVF